MNDKTFKYLRELGKSNYYQTLYNQAKELHLKLFKNQEDLTDIQIQFIGFLNFYSNLFLDFALGEIEEIVFTDEIYENAYVYWKHHKKEDSEEQQPKMRKETEKLRNETSEKTSRRSFQWVFKHPLKKVK